MARLFGLCLPQFPTHWSAVFPAGGEEDGDDGHAVYDLARKHDLMRLMVRKKVSGCQERFHLHPGRKT